HEGFFTEGTKACASFFLLGRQGHRGIAAQYAPRASLRQSKVRAPQNLFQAKALCAFCEKTFVSSVIKN
ncbi:MAG TPA: hypothetical protein VLD19_03190, partial [Chitinophagaceae bacterium]|nr:hypothetical protein [Chitinophagaceae bacterium]